jgi:hypothetical protein
MLDALRQTRDPGWVLTHEGYDVLTESAVESRFAFSNGFLGMRAARALGRGPTWVGCLGYGRWASWPRCYVAGLFDVPDTDPAVPALVPVADWSRLRVELDGEPLVAREGEILRANRALDMRRGLLLSSWVHRTPAGVTVTGEGLRLVSLADRATGLQLMRLSLDNDGIDVNLYAIFAMAGLGMQPVLLERDIGAWRTESTDKRVAMTGAATLRLNGDVLAAECPFTGDGAGAPLQGRWPSSPASLRWRAPMSRTIPFRWQGRRWRAVMRKAGAACWPRTRPPGRSAGTRARSALTAMTRCSARCASPRTT